MSSSRARAAFIILVIVVGSAIAGAAIDRWSMVRGARHGRGGGPPGSGTPDESARRRAQMLERMTKELQLRPAQRAGIDSIMQRTDSALRLVRREMEPRLARIFDSSRAEISARLDSAQRVTFAQRRPSRHGRR